MLEDVQRSALARYVVTHSSVNKGGISVLFTRTDPPTLAMLNAAEVQVHFGHEVAALEPIYLGPLRGVSGRARLRQAEVFVVDLSSTVTAEKAEAKATALKKRFATGRTVMFSKASDDDVTLAGMAISMTTWRESARFDGRTGLPTEAVEGGIKRIELGGKNRSYPRTDPVAIGLIVSPDLTRILLVAPNRMKFQGMYTCISGFVDQCETVEEAFKREAKEEVGLDVDQVQMIGSQAWPIGRGGSCELMIGCKAVAKSWDFEASPSEIENAKWFDREEVLRLIDGTHPEKYKIPPRAAIAHHLINNWAISSSSGNRDRDRDRERGEAAAKKNTRRRVIIIACQALPILTTAACAYSIGRMTSKR